MPIVSSVQWIDWIAFGDRARGAEATCTIHFREGCEPSQVSFSILQFQNGEVAFVEASGSKQTYDIINDVHTIALHNPTFRDANAWFNRNAHIPKL